MKEKDEHKFRLVTDMKPRGSQPEAIKKLIEGLKKNQKMQTLLGVTGSGKSIDYEDFILIRDSDAFIKKVRIGEFVDSLMDAPKRIGDTEYQPVSGYKIMSFNSHSYEIAESEIAEISRHFEDYVFELVLDDNSSVRVTKDHNCFRFNNCKLELCRTDSLKGGDYLPLSKMVPEPSNPLKYANLLDANRKSKVWIGKLISKYADREDEIMDVLKTYYKSSRWKMTQIKKSTKERGISVDHLYAILDMLGTSLEKESGNIRIITKGEDKLPPIIPIDERMLMFMGMYVSEGCYSKRFLMISNSNKNIQDSCIEFWKSFGLTFHKRNKNDIQYTSSLFANFFNIFGHKARGKKIPDLIYNLSSEDLSVFLKAVFDGDGWVENNSVHMSSASKDLVFGIKDLLLRYGITSRITIKNVDKRQYYNLNISGRENLCSFKDRIGFSIGYKMKKLTNAIKKTSNTNVDIIPNCSEFIRKARKDYNLSQKDFARIVGCNRSHISMLESGKRKPSKEIFGKLTEWLVKKSPEYNYLYNLSKFNFRKIEKIRKIRPTKRRVYDLSVKNNENFIAGYGNIFVHNTFTMANVIAGVNRPALVMAHNKTLAAQLYYEFKELFPENRVEYFISYYDYYQPESYIPQRDMYIEKDADINPKIEKMRLSATASILSRRDTIVVASVSAIYSVGNPKNFQDLGFNLEKGQKIARDDVIRKLIRIQFERNDTELMPGRFRVKGDTIDFIPGYFDDIIRIEMFGDEVERLREIDKVTGEIKEEMDYFYVYPAKHFVTSDSETERALVQIQDELERRLPKLGQLEAHRLKQRTNYDMEMIREIGSCKGIENYSRHFDGRKEGERPYCLLDYFPDDFIIFIDESHQTIPQIHGMYNGDRSRKKALIDYGFRLPSAYDNRPLRFEEFKGFMNSVIFVSATPGDYERKESSQIVEQIVRPTGLVDPMVEVKPTKGQVHDVIREIKEVIKRGERALVVTLTKKLAEEFTEYLAGENIKARYMHSEIDTLERTELIRLLRLGKFDVLVGINLLREGLDIPEVSYIGILDADKEGFLRDARSLIQIIGRGARNVRSKVVLYADKRTNSISSALRETERRRDMQLEYNKKHGITPKTIIKPIKEKVADIKDVKHIPKTDIPGALIELEAEMKEEAENLNFERAIALREQIRKLKERSEGK